MLTDTFPHWKLLSEEALKSIDWFGDKLIQKDWNIERCPGTWTDLCRAIERWVIFTRRLEEAV